MHIIVEGKVDTNAIAQLLSMIRAADVMNLHHNFDVPVYYGILTTFTLWKFVMVKAGKIFFTLSYYISIHWIRSFYFSRNFLGGS
jgi:hypothetical protein